MGGEWVIKPLGIYIAYISWGEDGKKRPVLVISRQGDVVSAFKITSRYEGKSSVVKSKYVIITEWQEAGLDKLSYIDISKIINLPYASIRNLVGMLSEKDKITLKESLEQ